MGRGPAVFLTLLTGLHRECLHADAVQMGCANRWLGAVLGSVKYAVLLSMAVCFIEFIDTENDLIPSTKKRESALYYPVKSLSGILIPAIKDFTKRLTDTDYART